MSAVLHTPVAPARHATEIDAADLFAGAGGADEALIQVAEEMGIRIRGHWIVNHWDAACATQCLNRKGAILVKGSDLPDPIPTEGTVVIHDAVERVAIDMIAPERDLDLLVMAPPCTHFSKARGGKPSDDQQRATVEYGFRIVDAKRPRIVIIENVPDFKSWGPLDDNGKVIESRKGELYEWWKNEWRRRGYVYDDALLNSADYGARTSRTRFFAIARRDGRPVRFPKQTHSKGGKVPGTQPWRPAAPVIDFNEPGEDLWERERPLATSTVLRIAHGFERKGPMWLPLATSLRNYARRFTPMYEAGVELLKGMGLDEKKAESLAAVETHRVVRTAPDTGPVPLVKMLEAATSPEDVAKLLLFLEEQALVTSMDRPLTNRSLAKDPDQPMPAPTGNDRIAIAQPQLTMSGLGGGEARGIDQPHATFTGGGAAWAILSALILPWEGPIDPERRAAGLGNLARSVEDVFQTFTQRGGGHLVQAIVELARGALITPGHAEHESQQPRVMDASERPFWTMTESGAGLLSLSRFLVEYYSNGRCVESDLPMPPATVRDRFALAQALVRRGKVSVRTRMLKVRELAGGMGFPLHFEFSGTETEMKKQIGNAWEVNVGKALFRTVLEDDALPPTLEPVAPPPPSEVSPVTGVRVHRARKPRRKTTQRTLEVTA